MLLTDSAAARNRASSSSARGSRRSVALQQIATILVHFFQVLILSRILSAQDYGVVAMAASVFALVNSLKDAGLSTAVIQAKEISKQLCDNLFWIGLFIAGGVALMIALGSPILASWFREPAISTLIVFCAITFVVESLSSIPVAIAQRAFKFGSLAILAITAHVFGLLTGIVLALQGFGPWSIVLMNLVSGSVSTVGAFFVGHYWPGRIRDLAATKNELAFGGALTAGAFASYVAANIDKLVIGRFLGTEVLGIYTRAQAIALLPMTKLLSGFKRLNLAALARLQHDPIAFEGELSKILLCYLMVCSIVLVPLSVASDAIVSVMLGPNWNEVAPVFVLLAPSAWVYVTMLVTYLAHVAHGDTRSLSANYAVALIVNSLASAIFVPFGLLWFAVGYCIFGIVFTQGLQMYLCHRRGYIGFAAAAIPYCVNASVSILTFAFLNWLFESHSFVVSPVIELAVTFVFSLILMLTGYSMHAKSRIILFAALQHLPPIHYKLFSKKA